MPFAGRSYNSSLLLVAGSWLAAYCPPRVVHACGGTFCDGGPVIPMPVDQTGEDILFVRDGGEMEVHVRIQYTGEAERFAWMVPLPAIPEVFVGSEPLFAALGPATIPVWASNPQFEDPDDAPPSTGGPPGGFLDLEDGGPPVVMLDEIVGSFEVVVLQGGTAVEVLEFFDQNSYAYDDDAAPLIQQYLDEGLLITGVKLTAGAQVESIHPLVFRFVGDEPCVPIRLTQVAAVQDMGIRAYFLGQHRWAPSNYAHVVPNPLAYDWTQLRWSSYVELLSLAVDEAGGHAFATEYAGSSARVDTTDLWREDWTSAGIEAMDPHAAIEALRDMGLITWAGVQHVQVRALLREYIPVPADWLDVEDEFWIYHARHPELIDPLAWSGPEFAAKLDELVIEPGMHAADLLDAWPYLTRLHTTISPHEMTVDPIFHEVPELPELLDDRTTDALILSGAEWIRYSIPFELDPDGTAVRSESLCLQNGADWPTFTGMPRALRIEQVPQMGPPQVLVDNDAEIRLWIDTHNATATCESVGGDDEGETGGFAPAIDGDEEPLARRGGCGCTSGGDPGGPLALGFGALMLVGLRRREQRSLGQLAGRSPRR